MILITKHQGLYDYLWSERVIDTGVKVVKPEEVTLDVVRGQNIISDELFIHLLGYTKSYTHVRLVIPKDKYGRLLNFHEVKALITTPVTYVPVNERNKIHSLGSAIVIKHLGSLELAELYKKEEITVDEYDRISRLLETDGVWDIEQRLQTMGVDQKYTQLMALVYTQLIRQWINKVIRYKVNTVSNFKKQWRTRSFVPTIKE